MNLPASMAEALRLTRAGDLSGATALLRSSLGDRGAPAPSPAPAPSATVIDLKPVRAADAPADASAAGRFEERRHAGPAGTIDYRLYRPASARPGQPLVVMLHGCTQTPEDFARGTGMNRLADAFGFLVAYPRQTEAANQQRCWNWFRPGDQARGRGEPALIAGIVRDVIAAEGADAARVYAAGLSAGGAAAAIMADAYPDLFAAVGIHSGLAAGAARNLPGALTAMKRGSGRTPAPRSPAPRSPAPRSPASQSSDARFVPVITFHGDRDGVVHEANAREIVAAATAAAAVPLTLETEAGSAGNRRYTRTTSRDAAGRVLIEQWTVEGAGHAWSGGDPAGSHTDAAGPDASRAMLLFFREHGIAPPAGPSPRS